GRPGKALLSRFQDGQTYPERVNFVADTDLKGCREFIAKVSEEFGKPIESDGSFTIAFSAENYVKVIGLSNQWDVGNTRIAGGCLGSAGAEEDRAHNEKLIASLYISQVSRQEKLLPDIILKCSQQVRFSDGTDGGSRGDVFLRVNLNYKQVTNAA